MGKGMYRKDYEAITLVLEDWFEIRYGSVLGDRTEKVIGIWDTGNSKTVISQELSERLGIDTTGEKHLRGSSFGQGEATTATVNIGIGKDVIPMVEVDVIAFTSKEHYDVILGMDVIARGNFEVDSTNGTTILTFDPVRDEDGRIPILRFVYDEE